jgi:hypothetical protein
MEKDKFDYLIAIITALGSLVALPLTIISIIKLIKRDEQKQEQINELVKQTKELANHNTLYEKRIRMINKPRIWSNGGSVSPFENEWNIRIDNKGEEATITAVEITSGDIANASFLLHGFPFELDKGKSSVFTGRVANINPHDLELEIKVSYHDLEGYKYETFFKWKGGATGLIKTIEK